jgi:WD40 repeat protein
MGVFFEGRNVEYYLLSPSFRYLLVQTQAALHLVDLHSKEQKRFPFLTQGDGPNSFSPNEKYVVIYTVDDLEEKAKVVETATGKVIKTFAGVSKFSGFGFANDDLFHFKTWEDGKWIFHLWNNQTGRVVKTLENAREPCLSPDGKTLAAIIPDGLILLDPANFQIRHERTGLGMISKLLFSPDGKSLAVFFSRGTTELWDTASGKKHRVIARLQGKRNVKPAFSPDSKYFALACDTPDGVRLAVWDVSSNALLLLGKLEHIDAEFLFSTDSRLLLAYQVNHVDVWDVPTGQCLRTFDWNARWQCEWTRDARFITIPDRITRAPHFLEKWLGGWWPGRRNPTIHQVRVAEVATGRELARLEGDANLDAWLSQDGQTLVTKHTENGQCLIRVWDLPLRPPLFLVTGIPLGLGLIVLLFSRRRARRQLNGEAANVPPAC